MRPPSSSPDLPGQIPFVAEALARIKGMCYLADRLQAERGPFEHGATIEGVVVN